MEYFFPNMAEEINLKELLMQLHINQSQVEDTPTLYENIGYFVRFELWTDFNTREWVELSEDCKQGVDGSEDKARSYFDKIIKRMDEKSNSMNLQMCGTMLEHRKSIQKHYSSNPVQFVHAMAECFEQEHHLISQHENYNNPLEVMNEEVTNRDNDCILVESENYLREFQCKVQELAQYMATTSDFGAANPVQGGSLLLGDLKQAILACLQKLIDALKEEGKNVLKCIMEAMRANAFKTVSLTPQDTISCEDLSLICEKYVSMLYKLHTDLHHLDCQLMSNEPSYCEAKHSLKQMIEDFFQKNVIFTESPKALVLVSNSNEKKAETEVKTEADASSATPSAKGRRGQINAHKEIKVYHTKKNESVEAKVSILGFKMVSDCRIICYSLTLATEQQLASQRRERSGSIQPCGKVHSQATTPPADGEIEFKNIRITGYSRDNETVYEQLVRLLFTVEIAAFGQSYTLKAISLPFFLSTGAIQVLELHGSRMWYLANKQDLFHGDFLMVQKLKHDDVIKMLENRLKSTCPRRRRGLTKNGKIFLKERIPEIDADGLVTMHTCLKDKMKVVPDDRTSSISETYKFTFFAWYYALVNAIETYFLNLWHDGIIYELFSYRDSCEFLLNDNISSGCVILRPGLSKIIKPNSPSACIRFTIDMKVRHGGQWKVRTFPIDPVTLNNSSLYDVVLNNQSNGVRPKHIYTTKGMQGLEILKNYWVNNGSSSVIKYHGFCIERSVVNNIRTEKPEPVTEEDLDAGVRKRKTARQDSSSTYAEGLSSVEPVPTEFFDRRGTESDCSVASDAVSSVSCASNLERLNASPSNDSRLIPIDDNGNWQDFGSGISVDISHINAQTNVEPQQVMYTSHTTKVMEYDYSYELHSGQQFIHLSNIPVTVNEAEEANEQEIMNQSITFLANQNGPIIIPQPLTADDVITTLNSLNQ